MHTTAKSPSAWRISLGRGRIEVIQFFRERDSVVFLFSFPPLFLVLFATIFGNNPIVDGVAIYGIELPQTPMKWLTLGWISLLSFAVLGVLGVAISSLPRRASVRPSCPTGWLPQSRPDLGNTTEFCSSCVPG